MPCDLYFLKAGWGKELEGLNLIPSFYRLVYLPPHKPRHTQAHTAFAIWLYITWLLKGIQKFIPDSFL